MNWIEKQMINGVSPRVVFNQLVGEPTELPESISDTALWRVIFFYLLFNLVFEIRFLLTLQITAYIF